MQCGRKTDAEQEVVEHGSVMFHLKGADDGAGKCQIEDDEVKTADGLLREMMFFAQPVADEHQQKQNCDLLQHDEKIVKRFEKIVKSQAETDIASISPHGNNF